MTSIERIDADIQMIDLADRIHLYDKAQEDIDRYEAAQGTIHQVNFQTDQGSIAIHDPDMLQKAEAALTKMIDAKKNEQALI